jgi:hypothetical protein
VFRFNVVKRKRAALRFVTVQEGPERVSGPHVAEQL